MEKQKSIKKNMIMNIILSTSNFVFPIITYSYVARVLLPVGTGKVAFVQSIIAYFAYIATLGIYGYGIRECAKVRDNKDKLSKLVHELLTINLSSTAVSYIALIVVVQLVPKFQEYRSLFFVLSFSILLQTLGMEWLYCALEKYTYITIRSLIFKVISVALTFLLIKSPDDYVIYGGITIFTSSASNLFNFINMRKYIAFKRYKNYEFAKHFKPIMVLFFTSIVITIYAHFDTMMLGFMKGDSEVGIYNSAMKVKNIVMAISTGASSVLIPRLSIFFDKGNLERYHELLLKSLRVTLILVVPLSLFILINTSDILDLLCGPEYYSAKPALMVLMLCAIVLSLTNLLGNQMLIPKGDEKRYSMSVFIGMFINLGLNALLIPRYSSFGAAVATLVTESFNVYWMGRGCKTEIKYIIHNIKISLYLLPLVFSLVIEVVLRNYLGGVPLVFRLCIDAVCMFGIYYVVLVVRKEPILSIIISTVKRNGIKGLLKRNAQN